jgi:hypothetical protein
VHTTFIALHAAAGVLAFGAGVRALAGGRYFGAYRVALIAMVVFLLLAVAVRWADLDAGTRGVFAALVALAGVMVWRSERAARLLASGGPGLAFVHHVGFGLIGLFDAFWVVTLLRAGLAGWAVAGVGVGIALGGHLALNAAAPRLAQPAGAERAAALGSGA